METPKFAATPTQETSAPSFKSATHVLAGDMSPLQKDPPAFSLDTWRKEMEVKDKVQAEERQAMRDEVHVTRLSALHDEVVALKEMQVSQDKDRNEEARHLIQKAEAVASEWKKSFAKLSPSLTNILEEARDAQPSGKQWKHAADSPVVEKVKLEEAEKRAEEQRQQWVDEKKRMESRIDVGLKEQEKAFNKVLEQKGQEQAALVRMFHQKLETVTDSYEARLELSNAESDRIMHTALYSPPRPRPGAQSMTPQTASPTIQLREKQTPTTHSDALTEFGLHNINDPLGFSDSEVERQAAAASMHFAQLEHNKSADKIKKKRKKKTSTASVADERRMQCARCGLSVAEAKFCGECGAPAPSPAPTHYHGTPQFGHTMQQYPQSQGKLVDTFLSEGPNRYSQRHIEKKIWNQAKSEHSSNAPVYPNGKPVNFVWHSAGPSDFLVYQGRESPNIAPPRR